MRSLLFVPGDSERKLAKGAGAGADAPIIDLSDSVSPERKPMARDLATEYLGSCSERGAVWVRVNDRGCGELLKDLAAVVRARPAGIVLPKILGPQDIQSLKIPRDALNVWRPAGIVLPKTLGPKDMEAVPRYLEALETS